MHNEIKIKLFDVCQLKERGCQQLVSSSGGNAGVAAAYASRIIGIPCTVYVPDSTGLAYIELIKDNGAQVKVKTVFFWLEM
jgi:L-serine/L-threonine ammonia-lyase